MSNKPAPNSRRKDERSTKVFYEWLFGGDITYALLPLALMGIISLILPERVGTFILLKEWSFASIIFFGVAIRRFVQLKVHIQQTPKSYKLDSGVQMFIVFLVVAVLVLACVVLLELKVLPETAARALGTAQLGLFIVGLLVNLMATAAENDVSLLSSEQERPRTWYLRRGAGQLEAAAERLELAVKLFYHASGARTDMTGNQKLDDRAIEKHARVVDERVQQIAILLDEIREAARIGAAEIGVASTDERDGRFIAPPA